MTKVFSERLKNLRGNRPQGEISRLIGVNQTTYSNYELGKREPSFDILRRIAETFCVSSDYLLGLSDNPGSVHSVSANNSAVAIGGGNASNHVEVHEQGADGAVGRHATKAPGEDAHRSWFSSKRDMEELKEQIEADLRDEIARSVLDALSHIKHDNCMRVEDRDASEVDSLRPNVKHQAPGGGCAIGGCGIAAHCVACAKKK